MKKTWVSWSTGKDSAWTLYQLLNNNQYQVEGLFCTINESYQRTATHAVRLALLKKQAEALQLPLEIITIPYPCPNSAYEEAMGTFVNKARQWQIECFAYGDLFLQDIRNYREAKLADSGIQPIFPLWQQSTDILAKEMVDSGLRAIITCVDPKQLDPKFVGREFNAHFLEDLPESVDPCGENGEFHSFVFAGPLFKQPIAIKVGEKTERDGFFFADVLIDDNLTP